MKEYPSLDRLAELQQFIADFAKVKRVPHLADNGVPENDVEHSFGLAVTCWYLHPKIAPQLDLSAILQIALAHDIVEIHAGDTFVFDKEGAKTKSNRERLAAKKIAQDWPDFPELAMRTVDYMDKSSEEAKFVKAVDKLLPVLMIELEEGKAFWERHSLTLEMEKQNKVTIKVSSFVEPYYELLIAWLDQRNNIPK